MRFYKQETEYTCGPACMRMVLSSFGIPVKERVLARLMKTTKADGTKHDAFPRAAEKFGLNYVVKRSASIDDLRDFRRRGYEIVVCYYHIRWQTGHYAVLKKVDGDTLHFFDPGYGPSRKMNVSFFGRTWKCPSERGWFIAMKEPRE